MTEDNAKKKWCPFASSRAVTTQLKADETYIRNMLGPVKGELSVLCLASDCMAWQWDSEPFPNVQPGETGRAAGTGHCGLAGKP